MSSPSQLHVSVVCCTHNRVQFVREHYASIRDKLTDSCELLYALDHCTDGTLEYVREIARADPRVRYAENDGPAGLFSCRNFGLRQARGRYVHYLDDDDGVSDGFYRRIDETLAAGHDGDMLVAELLLEEEGQTPRIIPGIDEAHVKVRSEGDVRIVEGDLFTHILYGRLYFYNGNALLSREILQRYPFRAEIRKTADWLLYLEMSHHQPIRQVHISGVQGLYRVHANSMSIAGDKSYWNMRAFETLYGLIPKDHPHSPLVKQVFARALFDAGYASRKNDKKASFNWYVRSARMGRPLPALMAIAKLALV